MFSTFDGCQIEVKLVVVIAIGFDSKNVIVSTSTDEILHRDGRGLNTKRLGLVWFGPKTSWRNQKGA